MIRPIEKPAPAALFGYIGRAMGIMQIMFLEISCRQAAKVRVCFAEL